MFCEFYQKGITFTLDFYIEKIKNNDFNFSDYNDINLLKIVVMYLIFFKKYKLKGLFYLIFNFIIITPFFYTFIMLFLFNLIRFFIYIFSPFYKNKNLNGNFYSYSGSRSLVLYMSNEILPVLKITFNVVWELSQHLAFLVLNFFFIKHKKTMMLSRFVNKISVSYFFGLPWYYQIFLLKLTNSFFADDNWSWPYRSKKKIFFKVKGFLVRFYSRLNFYLYEDFIMHVWKINSKINIKNINIYEFFFKSKINK